jgi:hypothetical protein
VLLPAASPEGSNGDGSGGVGGGAEAVERPRAVAALLSVEAHSAFGLPPWWQRQQQEEQEEQQHEAQEKEDQQQRAQDEEQQQQQQQQVGAGGVFGGNCRSNSSGGCGGGGAGAGAVAAIAACWLDVSLVAHASRSQPSVAVRGAPTPPLKRPRVGAVGGAQGSEEAAAAALCTAHELARLAVLSACWRSLRSCGGSARGCGSLTYSTAPLLPLHCDVALRALGLAAAATHCV